MNRRAATAMYSHLLRHFLAVAEHRGITAAARSINITQPALTKSIRQLEQLLGVTLFERLPTGVVLTRYGEALARRVRLMDLEYRHALDEIEAMKGGRRGTLTIGAGPAWMARILPPVIAQFQREQPRIRVQLTAGVIDTLVPALLGGRLDMICSALDFPSHPEIIKEHLTEMNHVLVVSATHPLARRREVATASLLDYPWVSLTGNLVGNARVGSFFAASGLRPPQVDVETNSTSGLMGVVAAGSYIAIVPTQLLPMAEALGLRLLSVPGSLWDAPAGIAYRATSVPVPAVNAFCALIRAHFAARGPRGLPARTAP